MTVSRLVVRHAEGIVGHLERSAEGAVEFAYAAAWLTASHRFPISLSMPLREAPYGEAGLSFFANLLPEAEVRRQLCLQLGISVDNDFGLLAAIGGECAGALTIVDPAQRKVSRAPEYRRLSLADLERSPRIRFFPRSTGRTGCASPSRARRTNSRCCSTGIRCSFPWAMRRARTC